MHRFSLTRILFTPAGLVLLAVLASTLATATTSPQGTSIPTTARDYIQVGTQPLTIAAPMLDSFNCSGCHGNYDYDDEPYQRWASSMMAQSTRDPIFHAALAIAEQDADFSGELCLRCHAPAAWLDGRGQPSDGSALDNQAGDFDGVTCHICHRMVDPVADAENPASDTGILAALTLPVVHEPHTGQYVMDPQDVRRGPYDLGGGFFWHEHAQSPYHQESLLCATCHDVSNPAFSRRPDGTYELNQLDEPHATQNKRHEFPIERTYSEWARSSYGKGEIDSNGRFGGNKPEVSTCQDCHMPDTSGTACMDGLGGTFRNDLPQHDFNGANSWVLRAIRVLYPDVETGLTAQRVDASIARNEDMLRRAAELDVFEEVNGDLKVRVVNMTGHKLPTGYGEGRRMWLNIQFLDGSGNIIGEHGHYDPVTADLTTSDTRVWETKHGVDAAVSAMTGVPVGNSFHFVLNNVVTKDNRIPPRGYDVADFAQVQADPVGTVFEEQHYWDDTTFTPTGGAVTARVTLYHQTTSKEYIDFLRDENTTNSAGTLAWDLWDQFGRSAPVEMQTLDYVLSTDDECAEPIPYGLGKLSSLGDRPTLSWNGTPSASTNDFELLLEGGVAGEFAALFWGDGGRDLPFYGGSLHVTNPVRGPIFSVPPGGTQTFPVAVTPDLIGTDRYYQWLFRDTANTQNLSISHGLYVQFCN